MATAQQLTSPLQGISCHCWNGDRSQLALSPNNNEIIIFSAKDWSKLHTLQGHDMYVSAIDWCHLSNKIVSCSHDRKGFVWTFEPQSQQVLTPGQPPVIVPAAWNPSPAILRIDRAALDVKWSHDGLRFAVASGDKCCPLLTYDNKNDMWISKLIKKKIKSTVNCISFHPSNGQLLATGSTDFKCRVFSTFVAAVDGTAVNAGDFGSPVEFGEPYCELPCTGWVNAVAWSPSGRVLAFAGHDATIHFATFSASSGPVVQSVKLRDMPLCSLLFITDRAILGGGHDMNPFLFTCSQADKEWNYLRRLDQRNEAAPDSSAASAGANTGVAAARALWSNKASKGQDKKQDSDTLWTKHENVITSMANCSGKGGKGVTRVSTSSLDGRLVVWDLPNLEIDMTLLGI